MSPTTSTSARQRFTTSPAGTPPLPAEHSLSNDSAALLTRIQQAVSNGSPDAPLLEACAAALAEQHRTEQALRESELRFRLMIEGSEQVFFYIHDLDHIFEYLSPSVENVLGFRPDELVGEPCEVVLLPDSAEEAEALTTRALASGQQVPPYLARSRCRDGTIAVVEVVESPYVRDGRVVGVQGFCRNVTRRVQAEEALRDNERNLERRVEELSARVQETAILEERQRLARELHDSVTQAVYGLSLYAEAARRLLEAGDTVAVADALGEMQATALGALGEMRLLIFELRPPILEEEGLAAALGARLEAVERRAGLAVDLVVEGDARPTPEAEQELYRVAQEALNNALKHAHARRMHVRLDQREGEEIVLEVTDDGTGFEPSAPERQGGLGLKGMHERVRDRLHGTIEIVSAPGQGTTVRVRAPR